MNLLKQPRQPHLDEIDGYGRKAGPGAPCGTPTKLGYAEFRRGFFYDGCDVTQGKLGGKRFKYEIGEVAKNILVEHWSRPDSRWARESNQRLGRPGEGQGGPNKVHLDPKIV